MAAPSRNAQLLTHDELAERLDELYRALDEFNDGYYFESHETLEDLWLVTPLPERTLFQGIIQLAAGYVHLARAEAAGAAKLLDAAAAKLRAFNPEALGIDVASMAEVAEAVRGQLARDGGETSIRAVLKGAPRWRYVRVAAKVAGIGEYQLESNDHLM